MILGAACTLTVAELDVSVQEAARGLQEKKTAGPHREGRPRALRASAERCREARVTEPSRSRSDVPTELLPRETLERLDRDSSAWGSH